MYIHHDGRAVSPSYHFRALRILTAWFGLSLAVTSQAGPKTKAPRWQMGKPIVTYRAGPMPMTDAAATQMSEGGWNLVWCKAEELDLVRRHGLRGIIYDNALAPENVDTPEGRAKLDALIAQVSKHPSFYSYHLQDEPTASRFPALAKLVAYLREHDPSHLAYINLYPTYANNEQLGTSGDTVTAYKEHLRQYMETVKPDLVSYDHYHFGSNGDGSQYFLNLAMIRRAALDAGVPFLNIVQACSWTPSMRIPNNDELRWLVYTTLAYGGQGISYYVYSHPGHNGAMATLDGQPTTLYHAAKTFNREFEALATQLQPLSSLGAYHVGTVPDGAQPLPVKATFRLEPAAPAAADHSQPAQGFLVGFFGKAPKAGKPSKPTHVLVVNLDYKEERMTSLVAPKRLEVFDPSKNKWFASGGSRTQLYLSPGGGRLLRIKGQ